MSRRSQYTPSGVPPARPDPSAAPDPKNVPPGEPTDDAIRPQHGQGGLARGTPESAEGTGHRADVAEEQIAARAREIWETNGRPEGTALADWLEAERELCGPARP